MRASFEYKSRFTGDRCVCVITGADGSSANRKTGEMAQMWFLRYDFAPHDCVRHGCDAAVCGTCPLRGGRGCYVRTEQAPLSIWRKYHAGGYREDLPDELPALRIGAYGDPASVPARVFKAMLYSLCPERWTGYTHGWRRAPWLRDWCMASVERPDDAVRAHTFGWSVFQTIRPEERAWEDRQCAAVARGVHCADCLKCDGAHPPHGQRWIQIPAHGARKNMVHA